MAQSAPPKPGWHTHCAALSEPTVAVVSVRPQGLQESVVLPALQVPTGQASQMGQVVHDRGAPAAGSAISKQSVQHSEKHKKGMQWL
jgi:hypothetical protein